MNEFVPLPEVESNTVELRLKLPPFIDPAKIGVHIRRLEMIARFCGILSIHFMTVDESFDEPDMTVSGAMGNGLAVADISSSRKKDRPPPSRSYSTAGLFKVAKWLLAAPKLSSPDINKEAAQSPKGVRSTEAYAKIYNREILHALRNLGTRQALRPGFAESFIDIFANAPPTDDASSVVRRTVMANVVRKIFTLLGFFMHTLETRQLVTGIPKRFPRFSLIDPLGIELDRALIIQLLTRLQVVKALD